MSGMFAGFVPPQVLLLWATTSILIIIAVVWLHRIWLKRILLSDFVLSMIVLVEYVMHEPPIGPIYYTMSATGMSRAMRPDTHVHTSVQTWAHSIAIVTLCLWSLYLANLVQRQILERKRVIRDEP